jgi:hypothetical protein
MTEKKIVTLEIMPKDLKVGDRLTHIKHTNGEWGKHTSGVVQVVDPTRSAWDYKTTSSKCAHSWYGLVRVEREVATTASGNAPRDPRVLHDFGDGTGIVLKRECGTTQERSGDSFSVHSLVEHHTGHEFEPHYKGGEYAGTYAACYVRVRLDELPELTTPRATTPSAPPVILPCIGPSIDDLRKASPLFASLREQVTEGLTKAKRNEASAAWSVALRKLQEKSKQEAREKDRAQVVVDYDYDLMMVKVD